MFLVDSHCHLDGLDYQTLHKNVDDVLAKAAARDVKFCLAVATTLPGYRSMRELVGMRDNVVFSCGVHPLNQDEPWEVETLRALAAEEGVVAMGETGLDYFYTPETKAQQQSSFRDHIRIGRELNKPVIVHTRDARADTLAILREEKVTDCGGVLHCFTEDRRQRASCSIWGSISRFPVSSLFVTPSSCVMRRATCRWIACWLKPIRRTWRRFPTAAKRTSRRWSVTLPSIWRY